MALLDSLPMFSQLSEREKSTLLAIFSQRTYTAGDVLCREGDRAFSFFVLCDGLVEIFKDLGGDVGREKLGQLGRGSMVGQVSLIDGKPRSATVVAKTEVLTLECSREDFDRLFNAGSPFAFKVMDQIMIHLSRRLRDANGQLYNLYSRPTETLLKLHNACLKIQRTINDTHDSWDQVDIMNDNT
ncbi:MAG: CRP-like cAMP-binding protein [Myxococcota bacterium]|jgi:CRP-like cAMP-binding protein